MEKERELRTEFSREEMAQKVELYNAVTKDHLKMTLVSGGWRSAVFALEGFLLRTALVHPHGCFRRLFSFRLYRV